MRRPTALLTLLATMLTLAPAPARADFEKVEGAAIIQLTVDARDLPRNLLTSEMTITAPDGIDALAFPLWIPGNHAPSGPVQNIAGIEVFGCDGEPVSWTRSMENPERIDLDLPEDCTRIRVKMRYIASQPSVISGSSDSYGRPNFGGINWNTVVLYPIGPEGDEYTHQNTKVTPQLTVLADPPSERWDASTSLRRATIRIKPPYGRHIYPYATVSLAVLVDSPVILGEHLNTVELEPVSGAPHRFHAVASEPRFTELHDWFIDDLNEMHEQAVKIFGPFPRERFEYLVVLDDHVRFGIEHAESTYIGTKQRRLIDAQETDLKGGGGELTVIPHEYIHVWVGKLRAPEGMRNDAFHEARQTEGLWLYEGLTTYYTDVLAARAGMLTRAQYEDRLASTIVAYRQRAGRMWRPLTDTARAAGLLRDRGEFWIDYRRGQDYYREGALFWMEADAIIRAASGGEKSLDDFCKKFFDVPAKPAGRLATFSRADVIETLSELAPNTDWDAMVRERIEQPREDLSFDTLLEALGVDLVFANEPTELQKDDTGSTLRLRTSLGMDVDGKGNITHLTPNSPADTQSLAYGMRILSVDGFVFSTERLERAVENSPETGRIELIVAFGDRIEEKTIRYDGGMRWPRLEAEEGATDHIGDIISPR